jgi:uncharacterized OB-fold protein
MMAEPSVPVPLPEPTEETRPFWDACARDTLVIQHCDQCGHQWLPPMSACPKCLAAEVRWVPASGRGYVYTWTVYHQAYHPAFPVPYNVAVIELEEGPRLVSNIVECPLDQIRIGMPVEVVFDHVAEGIALPKFRPAQRGSRTPPGR